MIDPKREANALQQLPLDLVIDEENQGAGGGFISPADAQRISEAARAAFESTGAAWMEEYRRLREVGWPWRVACYIAWAASPKRERRPKTQAELASQILGLTSDRQIGTWRKKNPVIDETVGLLQAAPLLAHRRDIYDALVESATNPDYKGHQDRKLALELLGDYVPRKDLKLSGSVAGRGVSEKSDDELRALLGEEDAAEAADAATAADEESAGALSSGDDAEGEE